MEKRRRTRTRSRETALLCRLLRLSPERLFVNRIPGARGILLHKSEKTMARAQCEAPPRERRRWLSAGAAAYHVLAGRPVTFEAGEKCISLSSVVVWLAAQCRPSNTEYGCLEEAYDRAEERWSGWTGILTQTLCALSGRSVDGDSDCVAWVVNSHVIWGFRVEHAIEEALCPTVTASLPVHHSFTRDDEGLRCSCGGLFHPYPDCCRVARGRWKIEPGGSELLPLGAPAICCSRAVPGVRCERCGAVSALGDYDSDEPPTSP